VRFEKSPPFSTPLVYCSCSACVGLLWQLHSILCWGRSPGTSSLREPSALDAVACGLVDATAMDAVRDDSAERFAPIEPLMVVFVPAARTNRLSVLFWDTMLLMSVLFLGYLLYGW